MHTRILSVHTVEVHFISMHLMFICVLLFLAVARWA